MENNYRNVLIRLKESASVSGSSPAESCRTQCGTAVPDGMLFTNLNIIVSILATEAKKNSIHSGVDGGAIRTECRPTGLSVERHEWNVECKAWSHVKTMPD